MVRKRTAGVKANQSPPDSAVPDFTKLTVAQLKTECQTRGLDDKGKKQELIDRLAEESGNDGPPVAKMKKQTTIQRAMAVVAADVAKNKSQPKSFKVDEYFYDQNPMELSAQVHEDYSCMLNQTNIGNNNNKYYVIQVLECSNGFISFNRWGRVGEPGATTQQGPFPTVDKAIEAFEKKFKDKTKNDWDKRSKFKAVSGKYTLIEMGNDDEDESETVVTMTTANNATAVTVRTQPSKLDPSTQAFVKLIFNNDMFKDALVKLDIDIKKMPLGKLSKAQIVKGFQALDAMKTTLDGAKPSTATLTKLSNDFYTAIPHNFGRQRPPIIKDQVTLRSKLDMLITLSDIEMAQDMLKSKAKPAIKGPKADLPPHPLDENYDLLRCALEPLNKNEKEFKIIKNYVDATKPSYYGNFKLENVWRADRQGDERFKAHDAIANRKLLWHGTNVAVVAAILKSGLRIMPHSGGRVGRGIYLASENSKSAGYVGTAEDGTGIMFLVEAALGNIKEINKDDHTLKAAPSGYDSIVARGSVEPDPKKDTELIIDGKAVAVPQGKPVNQSKFSNSYFDQSEYLVYKESQARLRYVLEFKFL